MSNLTTPSLTSALSELSPASLFPPCFILVSPGYIGTELIQGSPSMYPSTSAGFISLNSSTVLVRICASMLLFPKSLLAFSSYCALSPAELTAFFISVFNTTFPLTPSFHHYKLNIDNKQLEKRITMSLANSSLTISSTISCITFV